MLLELDFSDAIPVYRQIRNQIVRAIAEGGLAPGERLPTVRALASECGINVMTASKAYQLLKQEGHVRGDRRGGTFVAEPASGSATKATNWRASMRITPRDKHVPGARCSQSTLRLPAQILCCGHASTISGGRNLSNASTSSPMTLRARRAARDSDGGQRDRSAHDIPAASA